MSEQSFDPRDAYELKEYSAEPEWKDVQERLDVLAIPEDPHARADDIAKNFASRGLDIEMLTLAVHQVLVPNYESKPTDFAMAVGKGESRTELMKPEDRSALFDEAARLIRELDSRRNKENDENFLERAAYIIALTTVVTHQFAEGNGRTARFIGELIRSGSQGNEDSLKIAGKNRPEPHKGYRINSYLPHKDNGLNNYELLSVAASLDIDLSDESAYINQANKAFMTPYY